MCIAVVSPAGVKCPTLETLKNCWDNNRDGAGFAFPVRGGVKIQKGYMTWDAFKDAFEAANNRYDFNSLPILIHFRITSRGATCPELTHPFPLHYDTGILKKLEYVSDYAVIHNGTITMVSAPYNGDVSDTLVFIRDYLTLIAKNPHWNHIKENIQLIHKLADSKMAILDKDGYVCMTDGFEEFEGNFYSNTSYKESRYRYHSSNNPHYSSYYNLYDDYGRYDDYDSYNYDYNNGYHAYDFTATRATSTNTSDDVFDFTHFDSDYTDSERKLMSLKVGWTVSYNGIDMFIGTQEDVDTYFVDRKRNLWEAIKEHTKNPDGSESYVVCSYELIAEGVRVYDASANEQTWLPSETVKNNMFKE